jgi:hypothetical protein
VGRLVEQVVLSHTLITLGHKVVRPELHTLESVDRLILPLVPVLLDLAMAPAVAPALVVPKRVLPEHRESFASGNTPKLFKGI